MYIEKRATPQAISERAKAGKRDKYSHGIDCKTDFPSLIGHFGIALVYNISNKNYMWNRILTAPDYWSN